MRMRHEYPTTEAARFFVFVIAVVAYSLAALVYFSRSGEYLWGVALLVLLGTLYLGLCMFGSTAACQAAILRMTQAEPDTRGPESPKRGSDS
jgi:hypothetical protein